MREHIKVQDLREGDMVDLEGDPYADTDDTCEMCVDRTPDLFAMEYQEVLGVEQETPECVVVAFDFDLVGFPTDHELFVVRPR